jgi:hypothetical protein
MKYTLHLSTKQKGVWYWGKSRAKWLMCRALDRNMLLHFITQMLHGVWISTVHTSQMTKPQESPVWCSLAHLLEVITQNSGAETNNTDHSQWISSIKSHIRRMTFGVRHILKYWNMHFFVNNPSLLVGFQWIYAVSTRLLYNFLPLLSFWSKQNYTLNICIG